MIPTATRAPALDSDAKPRTIKVRPYSYDPHTVDVVLHKTKYGDGDEVYVDGHWLGTVVGYTGSLDRSAGRLRIPGKTRRLWATRGTHKGAREYYGFVSRAAALRYLIHTAC